MSTMSISTAVELSFDKFYNDLAFENIHLTRTLRLLIQDLEVKCIDSATSQYTTEAVERFEEGEEQGFEFGYDEGFISGRDEGYDEGFLEGEKEAFDNGYEQGLIDGAKGR